MAFHSTLVKLVQFGTQVLALSTPKPEWRACQDPSHHSPSPFSMPTFEHLSPTTLSHLPRRSWVVCASSRKPLIPISNVYERHRGYEANGCFVTRRLWEPPWLTCFNVSWRWLSHFISLYLLFLNFVANAQDYPASSTYACEDTSSYYSHVKHLRGEALEKKLNSIVAPHLSLSYKEVWDALKFLDAANVDEPDASS